MWSWSEPHIVPISENKVNLSNSDTLRHVFRHSWCNCSSFKCLQLWISMLQQCLAFVQDVSVTESKQFTCYQQRKFKETLKINNPLKYCKFNMFWKTLFLHQNEWAAGVLNQYESFQTRIKCPVWCAGNQNLNEICIKNA